MRRLLSFSPRALVGVAAASLASACGSAIDHPPALGDCTPVGDASCTSPNYAVGNTTQPVEAGMSPSEDADAASVSDADTCGLGVLMLASANPECLPCISQPAPSGCCGFTLGCSTDIFCPSRLGCAKMGALALATCSSPADLASAELVTCLQTVCSPMCMDLVAGLTNDQ